MHNELTQHCTPFIAISTMPQQQSTQIFELKNTKISSQSSLFAFFTYDPYP